MPFVQSLKDSLSYYSDRLKTYIFGEKNSRLDKIIVRFYSMREEKRVFVKKLAIVGSLLAFLFGMFFYFYGMYRLQHNLDQAVSAYLKLQQEKPNFTLVSKEFVALSANLMEENSVQNLIPAITSTASALALQLDNISTTPILIPAAASSLQFQKAKIDLQLNGVSLKKLIEFLNEIHQLPNKFMITKLQILQVSGNKLYFNAAITFEAYVPKQST